MVEIDIHSASSTLTVVREGVRVRSSLTVYLQSAHCLPQHWDSSTEFEPRLRGVLIDHRQKSIRYMMLKGRSVSQVRLHPAARNARTNRPQPRGNNSESSARGLSPLRPEVHSPSCYETSHLVSHTLRYQSLRHRASPGTLDTKGLAASFQPSRPI